MSSLIPKCRLHAVRRFAERYYPEHISDFSTDDQLFLAKTMYRCNQLKEDRDSLGKYESQVVTMDELPKPIKNFFMTVYTDGVGIESIGDLRLRRLLETRQQKSNHERKGWYFYKTYHQYVVIFFVPRYQNEVIATTLYKETKRSSIIDDEFADRARLLLEEKGRDE